MTTNPDTPAPPPGLSADEAGLLVHVTLAHCLGRVCYRRALPGYLHPSVGAAIRGLVARGLVEAAGRGRSQALTLTSAGVAFVGETSIPMPDPVRGPHEPTE